MNNSWLFSKRLSSANMRLGILFFIGILIVGNILGWSLFAHKKSVPENFIVAVKEATDQVDESDLGVVVNGVANLKAINDVLLSNIEETDGWLAEVSELTRELAGDTSSSAVASKVSQVLLRHNGIRDKYIFERVFKVEKPADSLTFQEVKMREIYEKVRQLKEVKNIR